MVIILFFLAVAFTLICCLISSKNEPSVYSEFSIHGLFFVLAWFFGICAFLFLGYFIVKLPTVATSGIIDEKIEIYMEENEKIEQNINVIVEDYLKYEQDILKDLKIEEGLIALVSVYPELKSDEFVQQQIDIYIANNREIKMLKEEKLEITKLKWILYFGK